MNLSENEVKHRVSVRILIVSVRLLLITFAVLVASITSYLLQELGIDSGHLPKLNHRLLGVVLLDHFLVVLIML